MTRLPASPCCIVRSSHAHGVIKGSDRHPQEMPGVLAVYTGADLRAAGLAASKCAPGRP
jgi:carbon-monoxide dehydrogenase large subunit